jgi:rubrerythrin
LLSRVTRGCNPKKKEKRKMGKLLQRLKRLFKAKPKTTKTEQKQQITPKPKQVKYYVCSECGFVRDSEENEKGTLPSQFVNIVCGMRKIN